MRTNLPVTQREHDFPADATLMSTTDTLSHITYANAAFIAVSVAVGAPPLMTAIIFGIFADVPISLTHYGNGCAPIYYGAGYVSQSEWWKNGFVMTTITTVIYLTIGAAWWKVIGLW